MAFNLLRKNTGYAQAFKELGNELDVPSDVSSGLERFLCVLYGHKECDISQRGAVPNDKDSYQNGEYYATEPGPPEETHTACKFPNQNIQEEP